MAARAGRQIDLSPPSTTAEGTANAADTRVVHHPIVAGRASLAVIADT